MTPRILQSAAPWQRLCSLFLLRFCQAVLSCAFLVGSVRWMATHVPHRCWDYPVLSMPIAGLCVYLSLRSSLAACVMLGICLHRWLPTGFVHKGKEVQQFGLVVACLVAMVAVVGILSTNR